MTKLVDNEWEPSFVLFRAIGYCLLMLSLFDIIDLLVPPHLMNPSWEVQTIGALIERVPVPLLGLGLVFYGGADFRSRWERGLLKFLSWASLVTGVLLVLLAPLLLVDSFRLEDLIIYQINTQVAQQTSKLEQIEKQLGQATTDQDINGIIGRLNQTELPPNLKNSQQLKSQILSKITKAKETIQPQAQAVEKEKVLPLKKNAAKWFFGTVVSAATFIYIWTITRWTRKSRRRSRQEHNAESDRFRETT